jgi:hypothetical protein
MVVFMNRGGSSLSKTKLVGGGWEGGQGRIRSQCFQRDNRESMIWSRTPVDATPVNGGQIYLAISLRWRLVLSGFDSEFGECGDSISNVGASGDISKQQFNK